MSSSLRLPCSFLFATSLALIFLGAARAEETPTAIKFSDPSKPGTLKIVVGRGDLQIKGGEAAEVSVKSEAKAVTAKPRKDGLRVLTAASTFALTEKDNVVILDALSDGWAGAPANFRVTVPRNTNVIVASSFGGDVSCGGVSGDLEIKNMSGEIKLEDISGGALVETMNGEIHAVIHELHDGKPLSFTSMNGEVVLRMPADTKANVRLRTQNGSILTDFDDKALVTKTETTARTPSHRITRNGKPAPAAPEAPKPATAPTPPTAPKPGLDDDEKEVIRATVRESVRAGTETAREAMALARDAIQAAHDGMSEAGLYMKMPPIPPVTGGKLVTGTLNGGGPEISVATMNGDVTLRQIEAKK